MPKDFELCYKCTLSLNNLMFSFHLTYNDVSQEKMKCSQYEITH